MDAPVGHQSARVVPEPAEFEMKAVRVEGPFRGGAEPGIVVHARGWLAVGRLADALEPIQVSPPAHQTDFAEFAGADEFGSLENMFATQPLRPHLDHAVVPAG